MTSSPFQSIPKKDLARSQLNVALRLYLQSEEYPSCITLAGAAEEVLGKIAADAGHEPALKKALKDSPAITIPDPDHSIGEERILTMGQSSVGQLLAVSHTEEGNTIHIISARRATAHERKDYEA